MTKKEKSAMKLSKESVGGLRITRFWKQFKLFKLIYKLSPNNPSQNCNSGDLQLCCGIPTGFVSGSRLHYIRYSTSNSNGMTFPLQRNPSVSSAGYHMEPPPPYPGPSAPPPPPDLQPFYLWSGAALPGQVPVMMESPRSFPQYPSHPPPPLPPRSQYGPPVQAANTAQVPSYRARPRPRDQSVVIRQLDDNHCDSWLCTVVLVSICCVLQGNIPVLLCLIPSIFCACKARSPEASQDWKKASRCLCCLAVLAYFFIIIGGGVGYAIYYYLVNVRHIQLA
ncbi:hypothetical protein EMCRGX_G028110 [Ephydatia muelleri]